MPRPRLPRKIAYVPEVTFYKPQGVPLNILKIVELTHEELEAIRLKHVEGFDQIHAAKIMATSQSTFQRILNSAHKKMSYALVSGHAIKILYS